jgi:hypothetical protein
LVETLVLGGREALGVACLVDLWKMDLGFRIEGLLAAVGGSASVGSSSCIGDGANLTEEGMVEEMDGLTGLVEDRDFNQGVLYSCLNWVESTDRKRSIRVGKIPSIAVSNLSIVTLKGSWYIFVEIITS